MQIEVTPDARELLVEELDGRILRISFTTGCGGSGYRLASAAEPQEGDITLNVDGITVALDDLAAKNLEGAIIRKDDEDGYLLDHPSAVTAAWCG